MIRKIHVDGQGIIKRFSRKLDVTEQAQEPSKANRKIGAEVKDG